MAEEPIYTALLKGSLKLSRFGEWWHNGTPFKNQKLSELFHRSIVWSEGEKGYFVKIGNNRASFDLEDTAYFVVGLDDAVLPWRITLADGSVEPLVPATLKLGAENQVYCRVKGQHSARFTRAAYQLLCEHALDERSLRVGGEVVQLSK